MKTTLTYKDFKSQSVYGNEVYFLMVDGTEVFVNLEEQTVEIEEELIVDASYCYFIQAAQEVIEEQKQVEFDYQDMKRTERSLMYS